MLNLNRKCFLNQLVLPHPRDFKYYFCCRILPLLQKSNHPYKATRLEVEEPSVQYGRRNDLRFDTNKNFQ